MEDKRLCSLGDKCKCKIKTLAPIGKLRGNGAEWKYDNPHWQRMHKKCFKWYLEEQEMKTEEQRRKESDQRYIDFYAGSLDMN